MPSAAPIASPAPTASRAPPPSGASSRAASATPASATTIPATTIADGRSPVAIPTATGMPAPSAAIGATTAIAPDRQAPVQGGQARDSRGAGAGRGQRGAGRWRVGAARAHRQRQQHQRHPLGDRQHGEHVERARLQPADEVGEPPGDAGGQPERYRDHFTLQPTGSVSAGSGAPPASTASSAPRSHSAPADGSS